MVVDLVSGRPASEYSVLEVDHGWDSLEFCSEDPSVEYSHDNRTALSCSACRMSKSALMKPDCSSA